MKQSQSLAKIPDTLVMAMEFIQMPTPSDQAEGLEELRKTTLRLFPELRVCCDCLIERQTLVNGERLAFINKHMKLRVWAYHGSW